MKVLIADPQPSVRHALSVWISEKVGWNVVGESGNSTDLLANINLTEPELIILDKDLPGESTKELVSRIRQLNKRISILLLHYESRENLQVAQLGVDFIASKVDPPASILDLLIKAQDSMERHP